MPLFERSRNFVINGGFFLDNSGGRKRTLDEVLVKLKEATALGVTYASIDYPSHPDVLIDADLKARVLPEPRDSDSEQADRERIHFIHSINTAYVQAHSEYIASSCATESIIFASFFFRRRGVLDVFPAEYRRLVPTLAYQICVAQDCPEELRVEILGALYIEPDIPEQTLFNQFQKLLIRPLQKLPPDLRSIPIVIILGSIHNCEDVKDILGPIGRVVNPINGSDNTPKDDKINLRFVITSVSYRYVLDTMQKQNISHLTQDHLIPIDSGIQQAYFFVRNQRYELPDMAQRAVNVVSFFVLFMFVPGLITGTLAAIGIPYLLAMLLGYGGVWVMAIGFMVYWLASFQVRMYRETSRLLGSRD